MERIFVYGSLRRTYTNKYARLLHASAAYLGKARMRGYKYKAGKYFGMKPARTDDDWVEGEVFEIQDPAPIFEQLDIYENPKDYQRVIHPAILRSGQALDCWVYLYVPEVHMSPKPGGEHSKL